MPKVYCTGGWVFRLEKEENGVGYYTVIHPSGRFLMIRRPPRSTQEMEQYTRAS